MKRLLVGLVLALVAGMAIAQNINRTGTLLASAARTAATVSEDMSNDSAKCAIVVLDITAAPGVDTVTLTIQGKDSVSGKYYTLLAGAAQSATGTVAMTVCPGAAATANVSAPTFIPKTWRVSVAHSGSGSFTYSVGYSINY